jgi:hypothetical protein
MIGTTLALENWLGRRCARFAPAKLRLRTANRFGFKANIFTGYGKNESNKKTKTY